MVLLIDNYDSFSYNLYQLVGSIDPDIKVIRNDELTPAEIEALAPPPHHPLPRPRQTRRLRRLRGCDPLPDR